jgi:phosphoribosylanthranilate isomerase
MTRIQNQNIASTQLPLRGLGGFGFKICGMKYPNNIIEVGSLLPDYIGFIFWEKSARFFDETMPSLPKSIQKVGVFVNASLEEITEKITQYDLQLIQLHGNESVDFCKKLKSKNIKIIKVFSVNHDFDFQRIKEFETVCDYYLFDTKGKLPGGNGITFDWEILKKYISDKPFFLSGGIGIEEIEKLKTLNLPIHAIDVNSKFETEPGLKDIERLKDLKFKIHNLK